MLDTSVAIYLRDGHAPTIDKVSALKTDVFLSIVTRVELEGGIHRNTSQAPLRRRRLQHILDTFPTLPFDDRSAQAYGDIVAACGYSRRKLLDRMIAAQALVHRATLITLNPRDFSDVPGLALEAW